MINLSYRLLCIKNIDKKIIIPILTAIWKNDWLIYYSNNELRNTNKIEMSRKASQPTLDIDEDGWFSPGDKKTD